MATLQDKKLNFVSRQVEAVTRLLAAFSDLQILRQEWDALGLGGIIVDGDLTASTFGYLVAADLANAFTQIEALQAEMVNHNRDDVLYKLVP
jgi:hypothetical protein